MEFAVFRSFRHYKKEKTANSMDVNKDKGWCLIIIAVVLAHVNGRYLCAALFTRKEL
jgi:hypothetical protein